jgi:hypothetical protein
VLVGASLSLRTELDGRRRRAPGDSGSAGDLASPAPPGPRRSHCAHPGPGRCVMWPHGGWQPDAVTVRDGPTGIRVSKYC